VYLHSALSVVPHTQGAQTWITQFYLQSTPYLHLPRKHLPDGATLTTGVPKVKCTKVHQMYQNSLGMMPSVLNTDPIISVPNSYLVYQLKHLVYQPVYQT